MLDAIEKWVNVDKSEVAFIGSFISKEKRDEEDIIKDNIIIGYGYKEVLEMSLKDIQKLLKEEKEDFVNW